MSKELTMTIDTCSKCPFAQTLRDDSYYFRCIHPKYKGNSAWSQYRDSNILFICPLDNTKDPGVKVGLTSIIAKDGKVLLGLRGDSCETARNEWAYPGGRMDYGEDPASGLSREIEEETSLTIPKDELQFLTWVNEFFPEDKKHYVSLVFLAVNPQGRPRIVEPDKCKEWKWFDPYNLPENVFWAARINIERFAAQIAATSHREGKNEE